MVNQSTDHEICKTAERIVEYPGSRLTTATEVEIEFDRFHRYCLARDLCQGLDVLDVASGEGYGSSILANAARIVSRVDLDPRSVVHAQRTYDAENLRFLQGSAVDLPLGDASVDVVVCFETLGDVPDHARFMAEVKRVMRRGGRLIVSMPPAANPAGGGPGNEFHVPELTAAEFESLLRANFKHVSVLRQRAVLGSLMVKSEAAGPWRSYERRSHESIEASSGLVGARLLVGIASDEELSPVPSSVYLDPTRVGLVSAREPSSTSGELNAQIVWLNDERTRLNGELNARAAELATLKKRFDRLNRSLRTRLTDILVHLPRCVGRLLRRPFARIAWRSNVRPHGWPRRLEFRARSSEATIQGSPAAVLDKRKATILVVTHEATRSGAPILALNLVQKLSVRYNVICLIFGGGELVDHFNRETAALYLVDGRRMTDKQLDSVVRDVAKRYLLKFAIVNSVASRRALLPLKAEGVPTITLVHEFSSNMRPRSALHDVITLSTETVFSTKVTLASVVSDHWLYPGTSIHLAPQGKCIVPGGSDVTETATEKAWLAANLRPHGVASKFLVIGVGNIELRKGVDLFIECATILKNQPGGERFQFVWIGDGFDPERELAYSVYLDDQIKRAEIERQLKIIRSTSQIELAYRTADLLVISSRLDPLPNVAIDALLEGRPVLCFERTTGIADFLIENGLGDQCVASYLDTHDLAGKVKALADSDDLRARVSERARAAAEKEFDMNAYVSKIEAIAMQAVGNETRVKAEVKTILTSAKFRSDFFRHQAVEALPDEKIIQDYLLRMACGLGVRKPMPGFQPTVYASLQRSEGRTAGDPFVDFLRNGLPEGPWLQRVIQNGDEREATPNARLRLALHLHAFYPDQLPGILERLNLNDSSPDLFISVVTPDGAAEAREAVSVYRGRLVDLQITPNIGRDVAPFLTQFGRRLCEGYDIIGHLHTKKSVHVTDRPFAEAWNTFLLENLIGGERGGAMLDSILSAMEFDRAIGIVFPEDPHVIGWTKNHKYAEGLATRMKCGMLPEQFNFPVGSMFWMRSSVLAKFVELELGWHDYTPEPLPIDGTIQHAIERLFGVVPAAMGLTCAVTNVRGLTR